MGCDVGHGGRFREAGASVEGMESLKLEYGRVPSPARHWVRRAVVVLLVGAAGCAVMPASKWVLRRAAVLKAQRECMAYEKGSAPIAYRAGDPGTNDPDYQWFSGGGRRSRHQYLYPQCLGRYVEQQQAQLAPLDGALPAFIGERRTSGGPRRLVVVWRSYPMPAGTLGWMVIEPAGLFSDARVINSGQFSQGTGFQYPYPCYYFGQRDPADSARFTLRLTGGSGSDAVEVRLTDADVLEWRTAGAAR